MKRSRGQQSIHDWKSDAFAFGSGWEQAPSISYLLVNPQNSVRKAGSQINLEPRFQTGPLEIRGSLATLAQGRQC